MADTVEQVAERLTLLEVTVARGFHDMEQRFASMSRKIATAREILRQSLLNHGERRQLLRIRGIR